HRDDRAQVRVARPPQRRREWQAHEREVAPEYAQARSERREHASHDAGVAHDDERREPVIFIGQHGEAGEAGPGTPHPEHAHEERGYVRGTASSAAPGISVAGSPGYRRERPGDSAISWLFAGRGRASRVPPPALPERERSRRRLAAAERRRGGARATGGTPPAA